MGYGGLVLKSNITQINGSMRSTKSIFNHKKIYISHLFKFHMPSDKKPLKEIVGKLVVTKEGKRLGSVKDITFETRTGELIQLILKDPTIYTKNLNLEFSQSKEALIPHNTIIAIGDFVVVSEEDLL
jgi:sporulation protein YlmC with PRC-barrel domain